MDETNKIQEDYWKILGNINEWIRFSDQKGVFVITTYSVILTLIYTNSKETYDAISGSCVLIIASIISSLTSLISICLSFLCLSPSLRNKNKSSIFYFGHISKHSTYKFYYSYSKNILKKEVELEESLAEQIYMNSKIADKKFKLITWSIRFQVISIILILIALIVYFI